MQRAARLILRAAALLAWASAVAAAPNGRIAPPIAATSALPVRYATDRIELQLRPGPARAARAMRAVEAARLGRIPDSYASSAAPDVRVSRLGVASVDRVVAALGDAHYEPEFRGETPPAEGSGVTDFTAFYRVRWPHDVAVQDLVAQLRLLSEVASADPIALLPVSVLPNDSLFAESWWFYDPPSRFDVHGPEAWDLVTGDSAIVVGVLDTGVLPYHPDLGGTVVGRSGQIYTNAVEAAGLPGVDDDGNGYVDDIHGWDFVDIPPDNVRTGEDYADQDPDPNDFAGHGTAVSGVVGAIANNGIGVTGTAWNVRIMPLRIGWSDTNAPLGLVDMSFVAQALRYATLMHVTVVNCSFATLDQHGLFAAAAAATRAGVTIVAAAGNGGQPHELASRPDVVAVAATGRGDIVAGFSNLGPYVDLAAPGDQISTTFVEATGADSIGLRQPAYTQISGTSFSSPMVAGAVALLQSQQLERHQRPLIAQGVKLRLMETTDDISAINPGVTGYGAGRLDMFRMLNDRPTSTATRFDASTVGPPVVRSVEGGVDQVTYVTDRPQLVVLGGQSSDTVAIASLSGRPVRQLAGGFVKPSPGAPLGGYGLFTGAANGTLLGLNERGDVLPGWPVTTGGVFARPSGGPALGDLDGDGTLEVVCGTEDGKVHAWHADGSVVRGFPVVVSPAGVKAPVALADLDGDGAVEIVAACADGEVHLLKGDGSEEPGWPVFIDPSPVAPVVTRFSRGAPAVIVLAAGSTLHAYNRSSLERFQTPLTGNVIQDPALGDFDGDGVDEIVLALDSDQIAVIDSTGAEVAGTPIEITGIPGSPPLVGGLSPGGRDVLVLDGTDLAAYALDGSRHGGFPKPGGAGQAPTLLDIDGDGATEVLAGTGTDSILYVYDAGDSSARTPVRGWSTPRGDFARTGSRDIGPPSPVHDLHATATTDSTLRFEWTAPGNEGPAVSPVVFTIAIAPDTLTPATFDTAATRTISTLAGAGDLLSTTFDHLTANTRYVVALVTTDAAGNRSRLSNFAGAFTSFGGPLANRPGPGLVARFAPSRLPVEWFWRAPNTGTSKRIQLFDVTGRRLRTLDAGSGTEGMVQWNGRDDGGASVPAGVYFARLISGSLHVQARVVLIP